MSCRRAEFEFQLRLGDGQIPKHVHAKLSLGIVENRGLLQDLLLNLDPNTTVSVGQVNLNRFRLEAVPLHFGTMDQDDNSVGNSSDVATIHPSSEDTEIVRIGVAFLVESKLGITASYMNAASKESPTFVESISAVCH